MPIRGVHHTCDGKLATRIAARPASRLPSVHTPYAQNTISGNFSGFSIQFKMELEKHHVLKDPPPLRWPPRLDVMGRWSVAVAKGASFQTPYPETPYKVTHLRVALRRRRWWSRQFCLGFYGDHLPTNTLVFSYRKRRRLKRRQSGCLSAMSLQCVLGKNRPNNVPGEGSSLILEKFSRPTVANCD